MQVRNYRPLNVVCLLSGGKDSVYHLHRIHSLGHNIVALATLTPTPPPLTLQSSVNSNEREGVVAPIELDSWIYQSVGTEMISGVAHALNRWPLYVLHLPLSTHAQRTTLYYEETSEDEVEYLVTLLTRIKTDFPTLDAVASGAILSHYQRLRIEHVCSRLGLLSLAYLWEQDQITLLEEMLREGISAVVIKTACVGLDKQHVGCTLNELHSHLLCLHQRYGMNVCGEGGEYETLTLDAPLYQARIVLDETSVIQHAPDVHLLRIHRFHLEVKPPLSTLPPPPPIIHVLPSEVRSPPSSLKQLTLSLSTPLPPPLPLRECNGLFHLSITAPSDIDNIDQATLYLFTHLQSTSAETTSSLSLSLFFLDPRFFFMT
jgi:diphthine-ammonia ligase